MNDAPVDSPINLNHAPAPATPPDMLAELGPLAYGLLTLDQDAALSELRTLQQSRAAQVPTQAERSAERESGHEALLEELGELDL